MEDRTRASDSAAGWVAIVLGIVTMATLVALLIFFFAAGPFGLIDDAGNGLIGVLTAVLDGMLVPRAGSPVGVVVAVVGAVVAVSGSWLVTDDALFGGDADWAGDDWIVFSTYPLRDFQCCHVSNLYRIRPDRTELEQLTHYETDEVRATQPRVTPDGLDILYTSVTVDHRVPALMPVFGGEPVEVVQSGTYTHPVRQPGECPDDIGCGTFP